MIRFPSTLVRVNGIQGPLDPLALHASSPEELKARFRAEASGTSFLGLRDADGRLELIPLEAKAHALTIGRRAGSDVTISWDSEVSAIHAELERIGDEWTVVDDGLSRNGTFVNGQRIAGRCRLRDGDRLRLGQTVVAFSDSGSGGRDVTRTADEGRHVERVTDAQRQALAALCRPLMQGDGGATPASNKVIAAELFVSEQTVKARLRQLFDLFGIENLNQNTKRATLAQRAIHLGLVTQRDL
jgi:hypothetical protein